MFFLPVLTAIFTILFFIVLPILGALFVRSTWHMFRKTLISAETLPLLSKKEILNSACTAYTCKAHGVIDAIGTDESVWVTVDGASIKVFLKNVTIYILAGSRRYGRTRNRKEEYFVERYKWNTMPSLPAGSLVFITGVFSHINGKPVFMQTENSKLLILIHDVPKQHVVYLGVFAGRPVNEYWNPFTKVSMALGLFAMTGIVIGVMSIKFISLITAISLTLAFSPILPFLPPGIAGFALYRRFWRRARYFRARRDVTVLKTSNQALYGKLSNKDIVFWKQLALINFLLSSFCFIASYTVNAVLVFILLRTLL